MNNKPKVSVVITVYNGENYMRKSLDSLVNQTLEEIEILLIDDGSTDGSPKICDEYAAADKRVKVIHIENGGIASARQLGIDTVRGEYVTFADADDWIEPDCFEQMYTRVKSTDADMLLCDFYKNWPDRQELIIQEPSSLESGSVLKGMSNRIHAIVSSCLFRRECYQKNNIRFNPSLTMGGEDFCWKFSFLKHNVKVDYLPKAFYHYCMTVNENSITKQRYSYEKNLYKYNTYTGLAQGTVVEDDIKIIYGRDVILKEFLADRTNSKEFKRLCYPLRKYVFKRESFHNIAFSLSSLPIHLLLYLSCLGLYRPCYGFYCLLSSTAKKNKK